jgi:hypothetical protein
LSERSHWASERRLVRADVSNRNVKFRGHLLNQGGLAHLARTRHDLDEPARLDKPLGEDGGLGTLEVGFLFTHDVEYFYSVS